jgi:hypothetical protein
MAPLNSINAQQLSYSRIEDEDWAECERSSYSSRLAASALEMASSLA